MEEENKILDGLNINEARTLEENECNVSVVSNEDGDAFVDSHEIASCQINDEKDEIDIDPIIILESKKSRFKEAFTHLNGNKIFALILAGLIIMLACFSTGYFWGQNKTTNPDIALDEKPIGDTLNTSEIYNKVNPSVVGIIVYNTEGESSMASGVVYSKDGYIVTNDHIYNGIQNAKFKIFTSDGKELNATYVAGDSRSDLAVLKTKEFVLTPATFGNSNECIVGEGAVAIGRPAGATNASNITKGIICGLNVRVKSIATSYSERFIQIDAAINPGSSGGVLCNMYGQVIGITSSKLVGNAYEGVGYAIPSVRMKNIVESLIKNKSVITRAKIGISYHEIDSVSAEINKLPKGLYVASVDKESKVNGQITKGDIITAVNGIEASAESVLGAIENSKPGDKLNLTVYRKTTNKSFKVSATLIADKGSSSYTTAGSNSDTSSKYNTNDFNFPEIE